MYNKIKKKNGAQTFAHYNKNKTIWPHTVGGGRLHHTLALLTQLYPFRFRRIVNERCPSPSRNIFKYTNNFNVWCLCIRWDAQQHPALCPDINSRAQHVCVFEIQLIMLFNSSHAYLEHNYNKTVRVNMISYVYKYMLLSVRNCLFLN